MGKTLGLGIIGCGDYLRWQVPGLKTSTNVAVKSLFDTRPEQATKFAAEIGGEVRGSVDEVLGDSDVDIVALFVPPWVRRDLFVKSVDAGKHVLATKPLAASVDDCSVMLAASEAGTRCGVMYGRTGNAVVETYKRLFTGGDIGRLTLFKQDWLHHYPQWNSWATDPEKNGGPFMDAMIHNLNIARYLMGRSATHITMFSDSHAQQLPCADTETVKIDFVDNGSAHLFITWAADLEVQSTEGNYREHIDQKFMVTEDKWYVTEGEVDGTMSIIASRDGTRKTWPVEGPKQSVFDRFADAVVNDVPLPSDLASVREAYEDIKLIRDAGSRPGEKISVESILPELAAVS